MQRFVKTKAAQDLARSQNIQCNQTVWRLMGPFEAAIYQTVLNHCDDNGEWDMPEHQLQALLRIPLEAWEAAVEKLANACVLYPPIEGEDGWALEVWPKNLEYQILEYNAINESYRKDAEYLRKKHQEEERLREQQIQAEKELLGGHYVN